MKSKERIELLVKLLVKNAADIDAAVEHFAKVGVVTINEGSAIQDTPERESQQKLIETLTSKVSDDNLKDENLLKIIAYFKGILYPPKKTLEDKLKEVRDKYYTSESNIEHCYLPMGQKRKGYAVIINHGKYENPEYDRKGAAEDEKKMMSVLMNFGFKVKLLSDKTKSELKEGIKSCVQELSEEMYDSLIVVVSSHGREKDEFMTKDNVKKSIKNQIPNHPTEDEDGLISSWKEVVEKFNCPNLKGKPKIFLFNFCRGTTELGVVKVSSRKNLFNFKNLTDGVSDKEDSWSDMLVCFSTLDGYYSKGSKTNGSFFLKHISEHFDSHGETEDICTILCRVSEALKKEEDVDWKQMCPYYNIGFSKEFKLGLKEKKEKKDSESVIQAVKQAFIGNIGNVWQ